MKLNSQYKVRNVAGMHMVVQTGKLHVDTTKIAVFNDVALGMWNNFRDVDFTQDSVADYLVSEYGISLEQAAKDAEKWINTLHDALLLQE